MPSLRLPARDSTGHAPPARWHGGGTAGDGDAGEWVGVSWNHSSSGGGWRSLRRPRELLVGVRLFVVFLGVSEKEY